MAESSANKTEFPDYQSDEFTKFLPTWNKVDACKGGTETMRAAEALYLPQFPLEDDASYKYRLETATFLPAYGDALDQAVGAITRKPPQLGDNVSPAIAADLENWDRTGTHWTVGAQNLLDMGLHYGLAAVLVDMPKKPEGLIDRSDVERENFRPYVRLYSATELQDWPVYVTINGAQILQQIRFCEQSVTLDGYAESCVERYRVWRVPVAQDEGGQYFRTGKAQWELWEKQEDEKKNKLDPVMIDSDVSPLVDIPVAIFNANANLNDRTKTDGPVYLNLADVNIKHYQLASDHEKILHRCTPILSATNLLTEGEDGTDGVSKIASLDVMLLCKDGGGVEYAEPSGNSLAERREWISGIENQLNQMGAAMFSPSSAKVSMTATEVGERSDGKTSRMSQIAEAWKDCCENVLKFWAQWKGEQEGGEVTLGIKVSDLVLSQNQLAVLSALAEKKQISLTTLWAVMRKMGVLQDDHDNEAEIAQIEKEQKRLNPAPMVTGFTQPGVIGQQQKEVTQ